MPATEKSLSSDNFPRDEMLRSIRKLDPSRAHSNDKISIRMLKVM